MAYNTAEPRAEYSANAGQTEFDFVFKIFLTSDLKVYLTPFGQISNDDTNILTENVDYTVSINGDNGGTMTLINPAGEDDTLVLIRGLPVKRDYEYQQGGDLSADTLNDDQDYQTYIMSDKESANNRFLEVPKSAINVQTKLPPIIPNKFLKWNAEGTEIEYATISPDDLSYPAIGITPHSMVTQYLSERYVSKNNDLYISTTGTESPNVGNDPFSDDDNWSAIGLTHVTTMAKFRSLKKLPKKVWLTGYHTKNDGVFGSNFYRLKGLKTTEIDNGGTIIIIAMGGVDYMYELSYDGIVNVDWFGTKGDGVTDDTVAIQKACLLNTDKGIEVAFNSKRIYHVTSPIFIVSNSIINGNNCQIIGNNKTNDCFRTAYYVDGTLTDLTPLPADTAYLVNTHIKKFRFSQLNNAMYVSSMTANCLIEDTMASHCNRHLKTIGCYFLSLRRLRADYCGTQTAGVPVEDRVAAYHFEQLNGGMTFDNVVCGSSQLGFVFYSLQATDISHLDCESVDVAIKLRGNIQNSKLTSGYFENVSTIIDAYSANIEGLDVFNNFFNNISTAIINVQNANIIRYNEYNNQKQGVYTIVDSVGSASAGANGIFTENKPKHDFNSGYPANNTPNGTLSNTNSSYYTKAGIDKRVVTLTSTTDGNAIAKTTSYEGGIVPDTYFGTTTRIVSNVIPFCQHSAENQLPDYSFTVRIKTCITATQSSFIGFSIQLNNGAVVGWIRGIIVGTTVLTSFIDAVFSGVTVDISTTDNVTSILLVGVSNPTTSTAYLASGVVKLL